MINITIFMILNYIISFNLIIIVILFFQFKINILVSNLNVSFFYSKNKLIYGFFFSFIFVFVFIFFMRLCKIFFNRKIILDLKKYFNYIDFDNMLLYIIIIIFLIIIFSSIKKFVVAFFKMHFLNLYFYICRDFGIYLQYFTYFDVFLLDFFSKKYHFYIIFFFKHFFKGVILFFFLKNIFFDDYCIDLFLLPYYSLYYFTYNIMHFFKKLKIDFDYGFCMQLKNLTVSSSLGFFKLYEYQKYLINNNISTKCFLNDFETVPEGVYKENVYYYLYSIDYVFLK